MEENLPAVRKPLGDTTIEELTGVRSAGGDVALINLNRASLVINCGSKDDFYNAVNMCAGIKAAVWNESGIKLVLSDRYTMIKYEPAIHPMAKMFFEEQKCYDNQWKGNYKPVIFAKTDLLKFLNEINVVGGTHEIVEAVKNMRLRESRKESEMISLEEDKSTATIEESFETNIPKRFTVNIPVTPDFVGEFHFEVKVEKPSERSGEPKSKRISLNCLNPLEIQRAAVKSVLDALPSEIPRLYGDMKIKDREW
jgi:hypothetical protein